MYLARQTWWQLSSIQASLSFEWNPHHSGTWTCFDQGTMVCQHLTDGFCQLHRCLPVKWTLEQGRAYKVHQYSAFLQKCGTLCIFFGGGRVHNLWPATAVKMTCNSMLEHDWRITTIGGYLELMTAYCPCVASNWQYKLVHYIIIQINVDVCK